MATFAKSSFNSARYQAARPTYPRQLFDFVFQYHDRQRGAKWDTALDLGCGTGQATVELTPFKRVIGIDPSSKMIEQARSALSQRLNGPADERPVNINDITFIQSPAEELKWIEDGSVDLMVAAQACHWFDWKKMWPEAARVLRKNGTAAFWGYSEFRLTDYPRLTPLITAYSQGPPGPFPSEPNLTLGPYWEQPGRNIVDNHLLDVPNPTTTTTTNPHSELFKEYEHVFFTGPHHASTLPTSPSPPYQAVKPVILRKRMSWEDLLGYLRSFSSLHTFQERFPEDLEREGGSLEVRFWNKLREEVERDNINNDKPAEGEGEGEGEEINVEWPLAVILVRRA